MYISLGALSFWNVAIIIFTGSFIWYIAYLAYSARGIADAFTESQPLKNSIYNTLVVGFLTKCCNLVLTPTLDSQLLLTSVFVLVR